MLPVISQPNEGHSSDYLESNHSMIVCLMVATIKGLPDKYQSIMVKGVQDKTLRKFYQELFGKKDENKSEMMTKILSGRNAKKEAKDNGVEENIRTEKASEIKSEKRSVKVTTESPKSRSVENPQEVILNTDNRRDPTFVLSQLMFYMSRLP